MSTRAEIESKTVQELIAWLAQQEFSQKTCELFEENEIDGQAFFLLTKKELEEIVKPVGPRMKLLKILNEFKPQVKEVTVFDDDTITMDIENTDVVGSNGDNFPGSWSDDCSDCSSDVMSSFDPSTSVEVATPSMLSTEDDEIPPTTPHVQQIDNIPENITPPVPSKSNMIPEKTTDCKRVKRRKIEEPPLPLPFPLPLNYPKAINDGLISRSLTGNLRTKFFSVVANYLFSHKQTPTQGEYRHVAEQIIANYPFLSNKGNCDYIVTALDGRIKYLRNYDGSHGTKVKKEDATKQPRVMKPVRPIPPPLPDSDNGADMVAYNRNIAMIQQQAKKVTPNKHIVTELMKKTFEARRHIIIENPCRVSELLKTYPCLRDENQIISEFNRIMGQDIESKNIQWWENMREKLFRISQDELHNDRVQAILELAGKEITRDNKTIAAICCLLYLIPDTRCKPDHELLMKFVPDNADVQLQATNFPNPEPTIMVRGTLATPKDAFLIVENSVLCKVSNYNRICLLLMGTFYVFNMVYTKGTHNFFCFLESTLLGKKVPKEKYRVQQLLSLLSNT